MIHHLWRVAPVHASGLFMVKNLLELFISSDALNNIAFSSQKTNSFCVSVFSKSSTQEFCQFLLALMDNCMVS